MLVGLLILLPLGVVLLSLSLRVVVRRLSVGKASPALAWTFFIATLLLLMLSSSMIPTTLIPVYPELAVLIAFSLLLVSVAFGLMVGLWIWHHAPPKALRPKDWAVLAVVVPLMLVAALPADLHVTRRTQLCQSALRLVRSNETVAAHLGVIESLRLSSHSWQLSGPNMRIRLRYGIVADGAKAEGRINMTIEKAGALWKVAKCELRIKGDRARIPLRNTEELVLRW